MIVAAALALLALPLIVLRGRTLYAYFGVAAATWLLAWIVWRRVPEIDVDLGCVVIAAIQLTTFSIFLARGSNVRWSAMRAALLAAMVYAIVVPSMTRAPIDGDEPYYLLVTESIVHDRDLDLRNQYRVPAASATGRIDITGPQPGDPVGDRGEQYSRHEPLLALLMVPGYLLGGLYGAVATIALFGVLLVRSTVRWMEDEGISEATIRAVFPFFAFAPPVLFYATRIWPEVPAAFFFVEALRGVRGERTKRWIPALLGLVLLKLRFVLVAIGVLAHAAIPMVRRRSARTLVTAIAVLVVPLLIAFAISGSMLNVHQWWELKPAPPMQYVEGLCGLLVDGMAGIAFQAPFYLFGIAALFAWRSMPAGFRVGVLSSILYVVLLVPRGEWFGGWAPPLRYIVFLMPVLALGAAAMWERVPHAAIGLVAAWTIGLVIHGVAWPWQLFHLFNGENSVGEWLSWRFRADFSRLFPSFVRVNDAAWWGVGVVIVLCAAMALVRPRREEGGSSALIYAVVALAMAGGFRFALQPADRVELEDMHVVHRGGRLYPETYTLMRAAYRGGWVLEQGNSLSFLAEKGTHTLEAITGLGATIEIGGRTYEVPVDPRYQSIAVVIPTTGRVTLRCLRGAINVDRMVLRD